MIKFIISSYFFKSLEMKLNGSTPNSIEADYSYQIESIEPIRDHLKKEIRKRMLSKIKIANDKYSSNSKAINSNNNNRTECFINDKSNSEDVKKFLFSKDFSKK
jgi:hypothetical protein